MNKSSRLGPVLAAMHNRMEAQRAIYGNTFRKEVQPYIREQDITMLDPDDEPPAIQSVVSVQGAGKAQSQSIAGDACKAKSKSLTCKGSSLLFVQGAAKSRGKLVAGDASTSGAKAFAGEAVQPEKSVFQSSMDNPIFQTPPSTTPTLVSVSKSTTGIKFWLHKDKIRKLDLSEVTESHKKLFYDVDSSTTISITEANSAWSLMDRYFKQQFLSQELAKRTNKEQKTKITELQVLIQKLQHDKLAEEKMIQEKKAQQALWWINRFRP